MPQAPWTATCMRKPPRPSSSGVEVKAHSGMTGSASRLAMMIARLRPIFSDQMPNEIPPTIAPMFMIAARMPMVWVSKWCCSLRKVG